MRRSIKKRMREQGVALMMVLSSIALLTTMVVEFGYNSHITYTMARNNLDRLQAYYLARSGLNFAKLQVKIEKDIRKQLKNYAKYLAGVIGSEPICKLIPFSTELLRGMVSAPEVAAHEEDAPEEASDLEEGESGGGEPEFAGILKAAAAGDFLSFDGDFTVACDIEDRKMNLNFFRKLNPQDPITDKSPVNAYENHKRLLESLLAGSEFEDDFRDSSERRDVANNIADWIDSNTQVDESPGFQGGLEDQKYGDGDYKTKNGKLSSPGELMLISGVTDDIYEKLAPNITIYGDDKVNLCLSEDAMVKAFVIRYSNVNTEIDPILPDNDELLDNILIAVRQACLTPLPKALDVANAILGVIGLPPETAPVAKKSSKKAKGKKKATAKKDKKVTAVPKTLTEQIITENRYYSFDLTGSAGDIILNIKAIMHVEDKDPNKWKLLFYRIQ